MKKAFILLFVSLVSLSEGKDLGVFGATFEIKEKNLKEVFIQRAQEKVEKEGLLKLQEAQVQTARQRIEQPLAGRPLPRATKDTVRYYDPTYVLRQNLQDEKGRIFALAGTTVNPLNQISLSKSLVFVDASDNKQRDWLGAYISKNTQPLKIILVNGNPIQLEEILNQPVYFDQGGVLVKKLGIQQVPCVVEQEGKRLRIHEVKL